MLIAQLSNNWLMASSACAALAVGLFVWAVFSVITAPRRSDLNYFEVARRTELRQRSAIYRSFEPLVDGIAGVYGDPERRAARTLKRNLDLLPDSLPWTANEFLAVKLLEGAVGGMVLGFFMLQATNIIVAVIIAGIVSFAYQAISTMKVADDANRQKKLFKKRLPYAIDLLALTMQAGATFLDSLTTVVRENRDHPLGVKLGEVLSEIEHGRTRRAALEKLMLQVDDPDLSETVFAVIKGEELGTPLAEIFRSQADQMRLKRSQWAEKAAGQAQVQIVFPGMLIMIACLLIIVAPFILKVIVAL